MTITQSEFDKYINVLGKDYVDDLSEFLEIKKKKFKDIDLLKKYHPEIMRVNKDMKK